MWYIFFQIIAEAMPISSSGHLCLVVLLACVVGRSNVQLPAESIDFLLHLPTLIIYGYFFYPIWIQMLATFLTGQALRSSLFPLVRFGGSATIITVLCYWLKKQYLTTTALCSPQVLTLGFVSTAIILFTLHFYEQRVDDKNRTPDFFSGVLVGIAQSGALLLPGLSRLAVTFTCLRFLRVARADSLALSVLLQVPLIAAAVIKGICVSPWSMWMQAPAYFLLGMLITGVATLIAYNVFVWTYRCALRGRWVVFAYYLIGVVVLGWSVARLG